MRYTSLTNRLRAVESQLGRPGQVLRITGGLPPQGTPVSEVSVLGMSEVSVPGMPEASVPNLPETSVPNPAEVSVPPEARNIGVYPSVDLESKTK
jgi:hypothetical protein